MLTRHTILPENRPAGAAMSRNSASDGDVVDLVGIEMDDLEKEEDTRAVPDGQLAERKATGRSYEDRFESILRDYYYDEKTWWDAVEDLLKKDADFAEKVSCRSIYIRARCKLV